MMEQPSSHLFEGYKSVGHITGPLPFIVRHGKNPQDTRILSIVGKTFHTYTPNLTLVEVSLPHENPITMLTSDENRIFSASGRSILIWLRSGKNLQNRLDNGHQADVILVSKLGSNKLVAVDEDNNLFNWWIKEKEILNIISFDEGAFKISAICHPLGYKDKALLGSQQGGLQLWNVTNEQCLYKYKGWDSAVTCLAQSPVQDVVGIGLEDGHVHIHNLKYDETVMKVYQEYGSITSMSFRLDNQPYLVTASNVGHLMIWNLERKRLSSQIRNAHSGAISKCQFLRNESLLVTGGSDNSLKVWSMDMSDGSGNLLHQRVGHSDPPKCIRFYGSKGFNLLSAGGDSSLKMFHLYSERMNRNLGTARLDAKSKNKSNTTDTKLPPITKFAAEATREKDWDNIAACHEGTSIVTTWNYDKCKMGEHIISQPSFDKHGVSATSVCMTGCGNFVIIGFSNGLVFKYNIQSGIFRQYFECGNLTEHRAHDGPVTGLTVDSLDLVLITGGKDSNLKLWNFKVAAILFTYELSAPIISVELHRESNLMAIALEDNHIEVMDLETRTMIRKLSTNSTILDMTFSPDSRWLLASTEDCAIRTWDLTLGKLIDAFRLSSACTSLSISSTGEFLATAHQDSLGVNIWCNYTIYCPATLKIVELDQTPPLLDMPFVRCDEQASNEDQESDDRALVEMDEVKELSYVSPQHIHESLITMSDLPTSRWKNLLNVEEIREKQLIQEEERREKPIKVPFFIPVKDGLKPKLDQTALAEYNSKKNDGGESDHLSSKIHDLMLLSPLAECLVECGQEQDFRRFLEQLKELGPSSTDAEIRSMGKDTCGTNQIMLLFLDAMEQALKRKLDFELVMSWLALFLKAHSDIIQTDCDVQERCHELLGPVRADWSRLNEKFNQIFCVLNFVRTSIL